MPGAATTGERRDGAAYAVFRTRMRALCAATSSLDRPPHADGVFRRAKGGRRVGPLRSTLLGLLCAAVFLPAQAQDASSPTAAAPAGAAASDPTWDGRLTLERTLDIGDAARRPVTFTAASAAQAFDAAAIWTERAAAVLRPPLPDLGFASPPSPPAPDLVDAAPAAPSGPAPRPEPPPRLAYEGPRRLTPPAGIDGVPAPVAAPTVATAPWLGPLETGGVGEASSAPPRTHDEIIGRLAGRPEDGRLSDREHRAIALLEDAFSILEEELGVPQVPLLDPEDATGESVIARALAAELDLDDPTLPPMRSWAPQSSRDAASDAANDPAPSAPSIDGEIVTADVAAPGDPSSPLSHSGPPPEIAPPPPRSPRIEARLAAAETYLASTGGSQDAAQRPGRDDGLQPPDPAEAERQAPQEDARPTPRPDARPPVDAAAGDWTFETASIPTREARAPEPLPPPRADPFAGQSGGAGMALRDLVRTLMSEDLDIQIERARELERAFGVDLARTAERPTASMEASVGPEVEVIGGLDDPERAAGELRLSLNYNLYDFGETEQNVLQAQRSLQSAQLTTQERTNQVIFGAIEALVDVGRVAALAAANETHFARLTNLLDLVSSNVAEGNATQADLKRAESRLEATRSALIQLKTQGENVGNRFERLTGIAVDEVAHGEIYAMRLVDAPLTDADLAKNPEIMALQAEIMSLSAQAEATRLGRMPNIDLRGGLSYGDTDALGDPHSALEAEVKLLFSVDLYDGGNARNLRGQVLARRREAELRLRRRLRELREEARNATTFDRSDSEKTQTFEERVASLTSVTELYRDQFTIGQRTIFELLESEADLLAAESDLINHRHDKLVTQLQKFRIRGGLAEQIIR